MPNTRKDIEPCLQDIFANAVPAYPKPVDLCSPINSSPYRMDKEDLLSAFETDPWRRNLLGNLDAILDDLKGYGVVVPAFLIGGGFVRRLKDGSRPDDIDGLAFYRIKGAGSEAIKALGAAIPKAKGLNIDLRFCPLDTDPIVMMKVAIFYSILFSKVEGQMKIENGLILYDRSHAAD